MSHSEAKIGGAVRNVAAEGSAESFLGIEAVGRKHTRKVSARPAADAFLRDAALSVSLLQGAHWGAEVEMQGLSADDEGGDGLHAGGFGLGDTALRGAEVHDFQIHFGPIEVAVDGAFGIETDGAAGVIEGGGGLAHDIFLLRWLF